MPPMAATARSSGHATHSARPRNTSRSVSVSGDEEPPLCGAVPRGGRKVPHGVAVGTAPRSVSMPTGSGADVPFYWQPPPMSTREHITEVKNSAQVPFALSTREQWQRTHSSTVSSEAAGPGAYDLAHGTEHLSTKPKMVKVGAGVFGSSPRGEHMARATTEVGPGEYDLAPALDALTRRAPAYTFQTARRPEKGGPLPASANVPLRTVQFIERHTPAAGFGTAPGHTQGKHQLPATADVPLRTTDRPRKHAPAFGFSSAKRF